MILNDLCDYMVCCYFIIWLFLLLNRNKREIEFIWNFEGLCELIEIIGVGGGYILIIGIKGRLCFTEKGNRKKVRNIFTYSRFWEKKGEEPR